MPSCNTYLGLSYLGHGVSLHGCSSKAQPLLLTLDEGYLLTTAVPDLFHLYILREINGKEYFCKKCKKAKWLSEEALKIAEKRRQAKGKEEKERYTHLNAEF